MPASRTTSASRDASLRRVAIVLSSLPASVAGNLISSMDQESKKSLRRAMTTLSDVDPLERQRALTAFKNSFAGNHGGNATVGRSDRQKVDDFLPSSRPLHDHLEESLTSQVVKIRSQDFTSPAAEEPSQGPLPLSFLGDVEDDELLELLSQEHPQTVALVLASISPDQAARTIPRLEKSLQKDTLSRIGRLGEVPQEALDELASHLKVRVENHLNRRKSATGQKALQAILAVMPQDRSTQKPPLVDRQAPSIPSTPLPSESLNRDSRSHTSAGSTHDGSARNSTLRIAPETTSESSSVPSSPAKPERSEVVVDSILGSTDAIDQFLVRLPADQLCQALGKVQTGQAMLTLCGLPNAISERVMALLPRTQAKQVRMQINSLASIQLRDIDLAKAAVAKVAMELPGGLESSQSIEIRFSSAAA